MRYTNILLFGLAANVLAAAQPTGTDPDFNAIYGVTQQYHDPSPEMAKRDLADYPLDERELLTRNSSDIPETPITWIGAVHIGGPNISITGSHHYIKGKLHDLGAHWLSSPPRGHTVHGNLTARGPDELSLQKRGRYASYCNNGGFNKASCEAIEDGQNYIANHFGNGICVTGPNSCGRFSCSYGSAILMCTTGPRVAVPCSTLAQNAWFIYQTCFQTEQYGGHASSCREEGQAFYENPTYNVLCKGVDANSVFGFCG